MFKITNVTIMLQIRLKDYLGGEEMKKNMIKLVLVGALFVGMGQLVLAEETQTSGEENQSTVTSVEKTETSEEYALSIAKSDIANIMKDMNKDKRLMDEQLADLLSQLDKATTVNEAESILSNAWSISDGLNVSIAKSNGTNIVKDLKKAGRITEEQLNNFLQGIENAKTVKEVELILHEARTTNLDNNFEKRKAEVTKMIQEMQATGKLTLAQMNQFITDLDSTVMIEQLDSVLAVAQTQAEENANLAKGSFEEKVYNATIQIEVLVREGKLTKEQGDQLLGELKNCQTVEEVDTLWAKVEKQVADNQTKPSETKETDKKSEEVKKEDKKSVLPQTGEVATSAWIVLGVGMIAFSSIVFWRVKRNR